MDRASFLIPSYPHISRELQKGDREPSPVSFSYSDAYMEAISFGMKR